jgi:hypothetical protein
METVARGSNNFYGVFRVSKLFGIHGGRLACIETPFKSISSYPSSSSSSFLWDSLPALELEPELELELEPLCSKPEQPGQNQGKK